MSRYLTPLVAMMLPVAAALGIETVWLIALTVAAIVQAVATARLYRNYDRWLR